MVPQRRHGGLLRKIHLENQKTPKEASPTGVNESHVEAIQAHKLSWEAEPVVHIRYYPEVWHESVRWTFSLEAAISKEYLSAEDSSRSNE